MACVKTCTVIKNYIIIYHTELLPHYLLLLQLWPMNPNLQKLFINNFKSTISVPMWLDVILYYFHMIGTECVCVFMWRMHVY